MSFSVHHLLDSPPTVKTELFATTKLFSGHNLGEPDGGEAMISSKPGGKLPVSTRLEFMQLNRETTNLGAGIVKAKSFFKNQGVSSSVS